MPASATNAASTVQCAWPRPDRFRADEWDARLKLAAAYRIFDHLGWSELIYNHISLRVPAEDRHFLINPFGLHYSEVTASNLIKVDGNGKVVGDSPWPINPAAFAFHGVIHAHMPGAHCVMHVHTTPTMAVCCLEDGLSYSNFYAAQLWGQVAYHDFEGITVHADEGARILAAVGDKPVLLLRNHGPVCVGSTVAQAFARMWTLQRACEVQMASQAMGRVLEVPLRVREACVRDSLIFNSPGAEGEDALAALQRLVDLKDPSYRS